ncbi:unnamed protein product [Pedinophyceae sp. YPF-701]|nr:unnamed protein product [Pedinophyceae sp. YPF-701]
MMEDLDPLTASKMSASMGPNDANGADSNGGHSSPSPGTPPPAAVPEREAPPPPSPPGAPPGAPSAGNDALPPPPPYDSVMMDTGARDHGVADPTESIFAARNDIEIAVSDPVKQGDGVGAFMSYKVTTKTSLPGFRQPQTTVIRRFRDFDYLEAQLQRAFRGIVIPALPEKSAVQKFQMQDEFVEDRRRALQVFLCRVAFHPILGSSAELRQFLEQPEDEWAYTVARERAEEGGAAQKVSKVLDMFRGWGHSASNLVHGKSDDSSEDPDYLRFREYVNILEGHTSECHRQAARIVRKRGKLQAAMRDLGQASQGLGQFEREPLKQCFGVLSARCDHVSGVLEAADARLAAAFEAPLKEASRTIKSVKFTMADRSAALSAFAQAQADTELRRARLTKLRGTPGIRQDRVIEAERDLSIATQRQQEARTTYDTVVERMGSELQRFQRDRSAELAKTLQSFVEMQVEEARELLTAWEGALNEIRPLVAQQQDMARSQML